MWTSRLMLSSVVMALLAGCGGATSVRSEPKVIERAGPLAVTADNQMVVALDWVVIRNGPGAWAQNAHWDEYLIQASNASDRPWKITDVRLNDVVGEEIIRRGSYQGLVRGTKQVARRLGGEGQKVRPGAGGDALYDAGAYATSVASAYAFLYGIFNEAGAAFIFTGSTTSSLALFAPFAAAPVLLRSAAERKNDQRDVARELGARQTLFPLEVDAGETKPMCVFFPITPSPQSISVHYTDGVDEHVAVIDTSELLAKLNAPE
ncbi:MAG: hypothetical protein AAF610_11865 [Pseudomonadota bacterium]